MLKMDQYRRVRLNKAVLHTLLLTEGYLAWCQIQEKQASIHLQFLMTWLGIWIGKQIFVLERSRRQLKLPMSWQYWIGFNQWN